MAVHEIRDGEHLLFVTVEEYDALYCAARANDEGKSFDDLASCFGVVPFTETRLVVCKDDRSFSSHPHIQRTSPLATKPHSRLKFGVKFCARRPGDPFSYLTAIVLTERPTCFVLGPWGSEWSMLPVGAVRRWRGAREAWRRGATTAGSRVLYLKPNVAAQLTPR